MEEELKKSPNQVAKENMCKGIKFKLKKPKRCVWIYVKRPMQKQTSRGTKQSNNLLLSLK